MRMRLMFIPMLAIMLSPIAPAFATDDLYTFKIHQDTGVSASEEKEPSAIVESQSLEALKSLGEAKIKERVKALEKAIKNLDKSLRLTTEQKNELITDLRTHLDALNVLSGTIKAEGDLTKLRDGVKSIYTDHRIFSVVLPRVHTISAAYTMWNQSFTIHGKIDTLQLKTAEWEKLGVNVKKVNNPLDSAEKHVIESHPLYQQAIDLLKPLKPADYPIKDKIEKARKLIRDGNNHALRLARKDLLKAIQQMKKIEKKDKKKLKKTEKREEKVTVGTCEFKKKEGHAYVCYETAGFNPTPLTVKIGTSVMWKNQTNEGMWVASAVHPTHQVLPSFDQLKGVGKGNTYEYAFTQIGEWGYHDHLHPEKWGKVVVTQ